MLLVNVVHVKQREHFILCDLRMFGSQTGNVQVPQLVSLATLDHGLIFDCFIIGEHRHESQMKGEVGMAK